MVLVKYLISAFIVHLVIASPQINLDLTDWPDQDNVLKHNCLHVPTSIDGIRSREIVSYCMSEWPLDWTINTNTPDPHFTFAELYRMNVTSEQLYAWSAPMNVIEWYQFYLNQPANYNASSLATYVFYNCTLPNFGPQCQYSFDNYLSLYSSVNEIIDYHYLQASEPETLTCYTHLQCNRSASSACLDWSDICDGKVDCIDGIDEENCFSLINNECNEDEYRCDNGQCIAKTFFKDGSYNFECLDRSDEPQNRFEYIISSLNQPTFVNENVICSWRDKLRRSYIDVPLTSSCIFSRRRLLEEAIFSDKPDSLSPDCFLAFKCLHSIPNFGNPLCWGFCEDQQCVELIQNTCPDLLKVPMDPIAYGHIYLVFSKESAVNTTPSFRIEPSYICYDEELCGEFPSNKTVITMGGLTCRRPEDFPVVFEDIRGSSYFRFIRPLFSLFARCNSMKNGQSVPCNSLHMYQCMNSSKCIPKSYLGDGISDCAYGDDEDEVLVNEICLTDRSNLFFKCQTTNRCIRQDRVEDYNCDCGYNAYSLCDDENLRLNEMRRKITFSNICDRFVDLLPILIDGQQETDETNCQYWPCNNTYTRCDGFWNCPNGADEVDCDPSPLIQCGPLHHICVSPVTNELICLPIERANDGNIDCLGGTDEPVLCPMMNYVDFKEKSFYCETDGLSPCLMPWRLCDGYMDCKNGDDEQFCGNTDHLNSYNPNNTDAQNFLYTYFYPNQKSKSSAMTSRSSMIQQSEQHCQRGVPLRVWLDVANNISTTTCLCPPSYYGDQCQFQNQRVSLTMQLNTVGSAKRTLFTLLISLIDDSDERIIHSYQQLTYIHMRDENTKFNFYLLYSTRPKDTRKSYTIRIDIYEKMTLEYRGSFIKSLKFPFLPVERVAVKLTIPEVTNLTPTCDNRQCIHGRCLRYIDDAENTGFCQCEIGWTGKYCNIPHTCTCSPDSLCAGIDANNQSICVCPSGKFGARCLLDNNMRRLYSDSMCYNGGVCLPADEHTVFHESCYCLCPKGFHGNKCEIPDTKVILSFHKDIGLSLPSFVPLRFIYFNGTVALTDDSSWQIICSNGTTSSSWSRPFNLVFAQTLRLNTMPFYYLVSDHNSSNLIRTITPSDRCPSITELFNETIVQAHILRRIKYYHLPCQALLDLSCFYDDTFMCLCQGDDQRFATCFEIDHQPKFDDFDIDADKIEGVCGPIDPFNSSTATPSETPTPPTASPTSSSFPRPTTTSGVLSIHACNYFIYVFSLLIFCLYIFTTHIE